MSMTPVLIFFGVGMIFLLVVPKRIAAWLDKDLPPQEEYTYTDDYDDYYYRV